jgi:hypothetical protein
MRQAEAANDQAFIKEHIGKFTASVPELLKIYETAFYRLDSERDYLRNIPWSKIIYYCEYYELTSEQTEWMVEIIERVDNEVLKTREKEVKKGGNA